MTRPEQHGPSCRPVIEFALNLETVESLIKGLKAVCHRTYSQEEHDDAVKLIALLEKKIDRAYKALGYHKCLVCNEYHKPLLKKKEPGQKNPGSGDD